MELRKIPAADRFVVNDDNTVTEIHAPLPCEDLPQGPWVPLSEWLTPKPQVAAMAGQLPSRPELTLGRSAAELPATVLVTDIRAFTAYAATATAVRLRPLRFAASHDGRAVVSGNHFHRCAASATPSASASLCPAATRLRRSTTRRSSAPSCASTRATWPSSAARDALPSWRVVHDAEGDNDGLVSVKSSTWGTHLGVWPADYWHTLNKRYVFEGKDGTGDIAPYYLRALEQVLGN